ncbi:hypothetical protein FOCC_FOCC016925 [Frankliniella occidentalis]|nr:hypothetical protein FOCC_FOCC016925 [Frankliniella occidentalis]
MGTDNMFTRARKTVMLRKLELRSRLNVSQKVAVNRLKRKYNPQTMQQTRRRIKLNEKYKSHPEAKRWWVRPMLQPRWVRPARPMEKPTERKGAWYDLIPDMRNNDPEKFYNFFRMSVASFDKLHSIVGIHLQKKSWRESISSEERLAIALSYYASGDKYSSLSFLFRVSHQVISNIVLEVSTVLWTVLEPLVFAQQTEDMWLRVAAECEVLWQFPHCCGAIDGKHIFMKNPAWGCSRFRNYKGRFSMILMGVADAKRRLLFVDVGASGRRGDSDVFNSSDFGEKLAKGELLPPPCKMEGISGNLPFVVIGDGAFEKRHNLINPFTRCNSYLHAPLRVFNARFSRARHCIEDVFGLMYKRYEVFDRPMEGTRTTDRHVVLACCVLHNFHLMEEESVPPTKVRKNEHLYYNYLDSNGNEVRGRYRNEDHEEEARVLERLRSSVAQAKVLHHNNQERQLSVPFARRKERCQTIGLSKCLKVGPDAALKSLGASKKTESIRGDGNCFYRALSYALTGEETSYSSVRKKLAAFMKTEPKVASFSDRETSAQYVRESGCGMLGKWATDVEIYAASIWLGVDIYVELNNVWQRFSYTGNLEGPPSEYGIYIKNANGDHFEVVTDVE